MTTTMTMCEEEFAALTCWQEGIQPSISSTALRSLLEALERDDERLLQGASTSPPPLYPCDSWPCEASCPVCWLLWEGSQEMSVKEVCEFLGNIASHCEDALQEVGAIRHFMNWWDENPRELVRAKLSAWIAADLAARSSQ